MDFVAQQLVCLWHQPDLSAVRKEAGSRSKPATTAPRPLAIYPAKDSDSWREYWLRLLPFREASNLEHLLDGLRKAGLPE